ncbi:MAG TPA: transposase [Candidatus Paceibacterota bacterium]|nr:transposase [Candidatus Paceibacterota bacterium]
MELFHVLNRGVDKRVLFTDQRDYMRFVYDLFEFNDAGAAGSTYYTFKRDILDLRSPELGLTKKERLVDIHGWCLMKNHYHLLLSERVEGGITRFLRKLNIGYAKYFNERHERSGTLFQGRTKKVRVEKLGHELHILHYVHLNPLDYSAGARNWRGRRIENAKAALSHLENYKWSSYLDYTGAENFPAILTKDFFQASHEDLKKETGEFLHNIDLSGLTKLTLE